MNELEFSYKVRALLNEGEDNLSTHQLMRLRSIRHAALTHHKQTAQQVRKGLQIMRTGNSATVSFGDGGNWSFRLPQLSAIMAILTLVLGLIALDAYEDMRQAQELADIDAAVLTDDLPPDAYADSGFSHFLRKHD